MTADAWRGLRDLPDSEVASPAPRTGEQGGGKAESTPFRTIGGISGLRVRVVRRARNITPILRHRLPGARRQRGESTSAPTGRVPPRPAQGAAPRTRSAWERTSTSRSRGTGPNRLTPGWTPSWTSQGRRRSGARSIAAPGSRHDEHAHERAVFHGRLVCWSTALAPLQRRPLALPGQECAGTATMNCCRRRGTESSSPGERDHSRDHSH